MTEITLYKTPTCPYCLRAMALLKKKGVTSVTEIDITTADHLREEMLSKSGGRKTVPQIFINGQHIGGFDDLYALDQRGGLDPLLQA